MSKYRYEIKFILNENSLVEAKHFIKKSNFNSPFPNREINSLYFDTPDFKCVKENLSGISNRDKIRLRWYNEANIDRIPELEIKKRIGRLGSKEKYKLNNLSNNKIIDLSAGELSKNIFNYIYQNTQFDSSTLNEYYVPVVLVNYQRDYYETDRGIRMTIDKKINFRNISKYRNIKYYKSIDYNQYIMELKFSINQKSYVANLIRKLRLTPKRHSKYLVGVSKLGYSIYI
jgi:SPX domain protein involved in polyphosphate accumulation